MQGWLQSRESREIFGETETMKMAPRRDQSRGLESRLQALQGNNPSDKNLTGKASLF